MKACLKESHDYATVRASAAFEKTQVVLQLKLEVCRLSTVHSHTLTEGLNQSVSQSINGSIDKKKDKGKRLPLGSMFATETAVWCFAKQQYGRQ